MTSKKFQDFTPKSSFQENDIIPGETIGVENVRVSYGDLKRQIQEEILSEYGRQSAGRFVDACCEHSGGIPLGYEPNLIYADGSQWNRTTSPEIARFIDFCKIRPTLKSLYQIPDSGDYFIVPDLRNKHRVGIGDINTPYATITSKVLNPNVAVATSLNYSGNHAHPINDIRGTFDLKRGEFNNSTIFNGTGGFQLDYATGSSQFTYQENVSNSRTTPVTLFSSHRAGVTATNDGGNHTHTATNTVGYADPNIFDTVNRVPAFAVFTFLDIAINDIYINPNTNIANVQGLQDALDSKVELADFNSALAGKVFNNQFRNSYCRLRRTGLSSVILSSPTVSLNATLLMQGGISAISGQVRYLGGGKANSGYPVLAVSSTAGLYKMPIIPNVEGYNAVVTIRLTGTFATARASADIDANLFIAGVTNPLTICMRRNIPNSDFGGQFEGTFAPIRVDSNSDPLILSTGGFRIELFNNNTSVGSSFTLSTLELVVNFS